MTLLKDVIDAEEIRLDRWTVVFHPDEKAEEKVVVNQACKLQLTLRTKKAHYCHPTCTVDKY